jgi:hypothetical protein
MARKDYAPKHLENRRMDDEAMARAKTRQKWFSLTGSGLGLAGLGLLGTGAAMKARHNPAKAAQMKNAAFTTGTVGGGVGALSGINFARIQGEESKRQREIKKSNYGAGYSNWDNPDSVEPWTTTPDKSKKKIDPDWKSKAPYTISRKAHDPERNRERRAQTYPLIMGAGSVGAGTVAVNEALKDKKPKAAKLDTRLLQSKPLRVGAAGAAAAGLAAGAVYHSKENNRRSYHDEWYPQRERN